MTSQPDAEPPLGDILQKSPFPTPDLPSLSHEASWNAVFTHQSLPDSNLVLAALGGDMYRACVTDWLLDADPLVTPDELEVCILPPIRVLFPRVRASNIPDRDILSPHMVFQARTNERLDPELLCAFSDVYSLPPQLHYARFVPLDERFTPDDTVRVFQAYVGGVYRDRGFEIAKDWIYELLEWDNLCVVVLILRMFWRPSRGMSLT